MEHHHNKQLTIRLRPSPSARSSPTPSAAQTESDDDDNLPNAQELLAMPFGKRADVSPAMKANARNVPVHDRESRNCLHTHAYANWRRLQTRTDTNSARTLCK